MIRKEPFAFKSWSYDSEIVTEILLCMFQCKAMERAEHFLLSLIRTVQLLEL